MENVKNKSIKHILARAWVNHGFTSNCFFSFFVFRLPILGHAYGLRKYLSNTLVFWSFTNGSQQKTRVATKQFQKNHLGLIFGVPGSK